MKTFTRTHPSGVGTLTTYQCERCGDHTYHPVGSCPSCRALRPYHPNMDGLLLTEHRSLNENRRVAP